MSYAIYVIKCSDGTYCTGLTKELDARSQEHQTGTHPDAYTFSRRPIELVWSEVAGSYQEAFQWEHQIKGWSKAKKEALIRGDIDGIHEIVKTERKKREKTKSRPNTRAERKG